jgi:pyruvate/2-oxoglutarate dehydrogenase complex dihydrolipoamide dehydrogenase (E3) component
VGAGRVPNVDGLNLEAVGVEYDRRRGVVVNDHLQTTNPHIFAAGDICMDWKFTHAADAAARIVIKNALFSPFGLGRSKLSNLVMPWVTYTDPEIAHVGLYAHEAKQQGIETKPSKSPFPGGSRPGRWGKRGVFENSPQKRLRPNLGGHPRRPPRRGDDQRDHPGHHTGRG